ncbi:MAG: hypothetical protein B7Z33_06290 [Sphingomonadales bacterium 12-68-11]|nr:MAG: hypothetical protein B7Z33_06290 [Sphingomonadales bacterium 12-68-11]
MAAASGGAVAQAPAAPAPAATWQFFVAEGGRNGAGVQRPDGSQIVLKCDKPGRREVHALILVGGSERLAVPNNRAVSRPIRFQFDGGAPRTENWGFYEKYAMAQGKTSDRALARFVTGLRGASKVEMRLDTGIGPDVDMEFDTSGSREAIARVYELCKDSPPA